MDEKSRSWLVIAICVILAAAGYVFFLRPYLTTEPQVDKVLNANSTWNVSMQRYLTKGPIGSETYRITNNNGAVTMFYSASNRDGTLTKEFNVPLSGPNATFLFQQLGADGIWELDDKPIRTHPNDEYVVEVAQTLGDQGGSRAFGFSDPHYWATTKAEEFQIRMPAKSMQRLNLARVGSAGRSLRDPRYQQIVDEIRAFGPPSVLQAEDLIRSEIAANPKPSLRPAKNR